MSSTTTNLGLTKPAYADEADIAVINGNMDLLDAAYGNINQSTLREVPFAIGVSDWSAVTGGFSATFNSAYITTTSKEILTYDGSLVDYAKAHIIDEKKSGGGGLVFTSAKKPTGTITGKVYVFDNDDHTLPVLIEDTVTPIANGGTGQSSLAGAQSALGITALSEQMANLIHKTNFKPTTDSDGDAFLTGLNLNTGVVVGIYPIRNGEDGTFNATWFLAIGGDTNGTSFGFKAYKDNGTVLANKKVNVDVYWIPKAYLSSN